MWQLLLAQGRSGAANRLSGTGGKRRGSMRTDAVSTDAIEQEALVTILSDSLAANPTRALAAIMFSDIAAYTAIMGRDEQKPSARLRSSASSCARWWRVSTAE